MKKHVMAILSVLFFFVLSGFAFADIGQGLVAHYPFAGDATNSIGGIHGEVRGASVWSGKDDRMTGIRDWFFIP